MHEYDVVLELLLQQTASRTLLELAGAPIVQWLNIELPEVQNTRVDLLGLTERGVLIQIEIQSTNDPTMALRMAEYCLRIYRLHGSFPRQILLYVGEQKLQMDTELTGPDQSFRYRSVDIRDLDGEQLMQSDHLGDNMIAILARWRDRRKAVERILTKIAQAGEAERQAGLYRLLILSGLRRLEEVVEQEARKMPILNDILENQVLGREFNRGLQEGREEGRQEGRQEGREEERQQRLKDQRQMLMSLVQMHFSNIAQLAKERADAIKDPEVLQSLILKVVAAQDEEEAKQILLSSSRAASRKKREK